MSGVDDAKTWMLDTGRRLVDVAGVEGRVKRAGDALMDRRLRVAVTGLSRSGKTVLVTCLAHHLERGEALPFLNAVDDNRYQGAKLLNDLPAGISAFPLRAYQSALTGESPHWPEPTVDLSGLKLELRFKPRHRLRRMVTDYGKLILEIIDYPGEWLIDLALLHQSYADWAGTSLSRLRARPYRDHCQSFLDQLDLAHPGLVVEAYVESLRACREARLSLLHPGRTLTPSSLPAPVSEIGFAPVDPDSRHFKEMGKRYARYVDRFVRPFKSGVIDTVDRQVVLIDLLESLNRGPAHLADTGAAVSMILESFNYGRGSYFRRLMAPKVEKVVFCATKADHVASTQHANLKALLQDLVEDSARRVKLDGISVETLAMAALRSTDTVKTEYQGQKLSCVRGLPLGAESEKIVYPGEIPPMLPTAADWDDNAFSFYRFAPRRLQRRGGNGHIRLDQVLEALIGDRLR